MSYYQSREKRLAVFFDQKAREKFNRNRPKFCDVCPIGHCTLGYAPPTVGEGEEVIVAEASGEDERYEGKQFVGKAGTVLNNILKIAGLARKQLSFINTIGCQPPLNIYPKDNEWKFTSREDANRAVLHCRHHHLYPFIKSRKWKRIIALGNHALEALTSRSGITTWRGSPLPLKWEPQSPPVVIPAIHPSALMRDGRLYSITATQDFRRQPQVPPENYNLTPTLEDLKNFKADALSFDFEWDMDTGEITLCGIGSKFYEAIVVPFVPPFIEELKRIFSEATTLIGHNIIGADLKYFEEFNWPYKDKRLVDTMLIQHLVQPDHLHGLGFVGTAWTNKLFWKGSGKDKEDAKGFTIPSSQYKTWNHPDAIPRKYGGYGGCISESEAFALYNARDVDGTYQASVPLLRRLHEYGMDYVYENVSIPIAYLCRDMRDKGMKLDKSHLSTIVEKYQDKLNKEEALLPEGLRPYTQKVGCNVEAPPNTYATKTKMCKGLKSDGTAHSPTNIVFTEPGVQECPVCLKRVDSGVMRTRKFIKGEREEFVRPYAKDAPLKEWLKEQEIKEVISPETGRAKSDKNARKIWMKQAKKKHGASSSVVNTLILLDSIKKSLTIRNNFAKDTLFEAERLHPNFKVHGTSEGRLSCTEPNFQNQPKEIKWIFAPDDPSFGYLNIDIIQGENMLTAHIAEDWERLKRLRTEGYDEHAALAAMAFGIEVVKDGINGHLRAPGKVINHGKNYLLGIMKALDYIHAAGFSSITIEDVRNMYKAWEKMNKGTANWQLRTQALIKRQGFLENAFRRKRWFSGRDYATKGMAFLPASTLADVVLRMMIGIHAQRFQKILEELNLSVTCNLPEGWRLCGQVHDSLVLQGPSESYKECATMVGQVMTQPWRELDNFRLGIEIEWGGRGEPWGACKPIEVIKPWENERY